MQRNREIISKMEDIKSVLLNNEIIYYIPEFQRNFIWKEEDVKQLLEDFEEDTGRFHARTEDLEGYLLGNIVLINQEGKMIVVDGQQRLTTLSLMAKAIHVILTEHTHNASIAGDFVEMQMWMEITGDIKKGFYILNDDRKPIELKIQHDPSLSFGRYYKKLISDESEQSDIIKEEDDNIDKVYTAIYEYLVELDDNEFKKFISYYTNKVKLIVTCAPAESKAFQLFEILNDRGRSLEPMDLIKNSFLKILNQEEKNEVQISNFNRDWQNMVNNLQLTAKKKIPSSTFLKQYLIAFRGENIKAEKLFDFFKKKENGFNGKMILDSVSNMNKISKT